MRKRAIMTYAATASIAYLVKNFTSPIATLTPPPSPRPAPTIASIPPLIPRYEIHTSAPPPNTPAGASTRPRAIPQASAAIAAHAHTLLRSTRRSSGSDSVTRRVERLRERAHHVQYAGGEAER